MRKLFSQLIAVSVLTTTAASPCWSQSAETADDRDEVARQIKQAVETLQSAREARRIAAAAHQADAQALQRQLEVLQAQVAPLETKVAAQESEIAELKSARQSFQKRFAAARGWIELVADSLKPTATRVITRVRDGVDMNRTKRTVEFSAATELLESNTAVTRSDGVRQFLRLLGEEWQPARSVTLESQAVLTDSGTKMTHAWVVGFGLVAKAFVSEDESTVGVSVPGNSSNWKLDLAAEVKQRVQTLLGVVREKLPPAIASIPVVVPDGKSP